MFLNAISIENLNVKLHKNAGFWKELSSTRSKITAFCSIYYSNALQEK